MTADGSAEQAPEVEIGDILPPVVAVFMEHHKRFARLFHGTAGGTALDGSKLEHTPTAYDAEFIKCLVVKEGQTDKGLLATALNCRPDRHAKTKGREYILGVVEAALKVAPAMKSATPSASLPNLPGSICRFFPVEKLTKYNTDPPTYTMTASSIEIPMSAAQLLDLGGFRTRYTERVNKIPPLPSGRDAKQMWWAAVDEMLATAQVMEPPLEATRQGAIPIAVERAVSELPLGDGIDDINFGNGVVVDQGRKPIMLFSIDAIVTRLASHDTKPSREEIAQALAVVGCKHGRPTAIVDGKKQKLRRCYYTKAPASLIEQLAKRKAKSTPNGAGASKQATSPNGVPTRGASRSDSSAPRGMGTTDGQAKPASTDDEIPV